MSIANPLVITVNAVAKNLVRINQDKYGSEYYLREATQDFRAFIRHSKERPKKDGSLFDRHNIEVTQTIFSTVAGVPDNIIIVSYVLRGRPTEPDTKQGYLTAAVASLLTTGMVTDLVGWQS